MVTIPPEFASSILQIIDWHLKTYRPERYFNTRLERIQERFYQRNLINGQVQIEESELYEINECVSNATNNVCECAVEKDVVWEIYNWVTGERKKLVKR